MTTIRDLLTQSEYHSVADVAPLVTLGADAAWVRTNMVTSLTGALHLDQDSMGLSNPVDRELMAYHRTHAEAVLVGANTIRAENYTAPEQGTLVAVTKSGQVYSDGFGDNTKIIVATLAGVQVKSNAGVVHTIELDSDSVSRIGAAATCVTKLQATGYRRIICEGGSHITTSLLEAGLVTNLGLTINLATGGAGAWAQPATLRTWAPSYLFLDSDHNAIYAGFTPA